MPRRASSRPRRWPPKWIEALLYFILPPAIGVLAGEAAKRYPPGLARTYCDEMAHYVPILGWVGIGVLIGGHAFREVAEDLAPEFFEMVAEAIAGVGATLADCIASKKFLTQEIVEALLSRPQPLAESDKPDVTKIREIFDSGQIDHAITRAEELIAKPDASESSKNDARKLLLQMCVYSNKEAHWRKAEPLLAMFGTFELTALLGFKFWTARRLNEAIQFGEEALQRAQSEGNSLKIARAKNNLAYYLADAVRHDREADARAFAAEAYTAMQRAVADKLEGAEPVLEAKFLTSVGFVHIMFAKTVDECLRGIEECTEGVRKGADEELLRARHLPLATEKIAELQAAKNHGQP